MYTCKERRNAVNIWFSLAMTLYIRQVHILCRRSTWTHELPEGSAGWQTAKRFSRYVVNFCSIVVLPVFVYAWSMARGYAKEREREAQRSPLACFNLATAFISFSAMWSIPRLGLKNKHALFKLTRFEPPALAEPFPLRVYLVGGHASVIHSNRFWIFKWFYDVKYVLEHV